MLELLTKTVTQTAVTLTHTWLYLMLAVVIAAVLKVHVQPAHVRATLARYQRASVVGAIGLSVATPLCSCGTMALVLAMLAKIRLVRAPRHCWRRNLTTSGCATLWA